MKLENKHQLYLQIISDLHENWAPHEGQIEALKPILKDEVDVVFLQCGRKFGKTEIAVYALWRYALLNPGSACYYVTPEFAHGRKLVWHDPRLLGMGPSRYVKSTNNNECMIRFKNGSFIQIMGSENFAAANGLRPTFMVYDEFCEFHPRFHETMNPNRIVNKCPLLIIGTPPLVDSRNKSQYIEYADECRRSKRGSWIHKNSYQNPHIDATWLDEEKERLINRGEEYLWYSQYEAVLTAGGKHIVFPMLERKKHVRPHNEIIKEIKNDIKRLQWYCISDPGTTTVMAFLFVAVNPYNKKIYVLDEIYEKDPAQTSVNSIMPKVIEKAKELAPNMSFEDDWFKVYDEAAAWFSNEVMQQFGFYFHPTLKVHNKKENGISLIKDILISEVVDLSSRCENLYFEMEHYVTDENGKFPKIHDHLIDCFRYFLAGAHYTMIEVKEAQRILGSRVLGGEDPKGYQSKRMYDNLEDSDDWTGIFE